MQWMACAQDSIPADALPQIARHASNFWQSASLSFARETLHQKALTLPKRKLRIGVKATQKLQPELKDREIISFYALSSFRSTPEALHEFRQVLSIDGKSTVLEDRALERFRNILGSRDDRAKTELQEDFAQANLTVAATDFGQLILLFTKANLSKYTFQLDSPVFIGADRATVIRFQQSGGQAALRIEEPGKEVKQPLLGELWVRQNDYLPLRITLTSRRQLESREVRDEARVDYTVNAAGGVLPASVVYRRYVNDQLTVENISEYSNWQPVKPK